MIWTPPTLRERLAPRRAQRGFLIDPYRGNTDEHYSNVRYLLGFDDTANPGLFPDEKSNVWTRETGGAPTRMMATAAASKYGGGSLLMQPSTGTSSDYTLIATSAAGDYSLGAGNLFTIEGWINLATTPGNTPRPGMGDIVNTSGSVIAGLTSSGASLGELNFYTQLAATSNVPLAITTNAWVHIAMTYDGTNKRAFIGGVLSNTTPITAGATQTVRNYRIGGVTTGSSVNPCYLDELRFTAGVCRYTATFTPPTAAFPRA